MSRRPLRPQDRDLCVPTSRSPRCRHPGVRFGASLSHRAPNGHDWACRQGPERRDQLQSRFSQAQTRFDLCPCRHYAWAGPVPSHRRVNVRRCAGVTVAAPALTGRTCSVSAPAGSASPGVNGRGVSHAGVQPLTAGGVAVTGSALGCCRGPAWSHAGRVVNPGARMPGAGAAELRTSQNAATKQPVISD